MSTKIVLSGITQQSTVNGTGLRKVFFSQGCTHRCKGCFNPETWPTQGGKIFDILELTKEITYQSYLNGVTFSGGDPFQQAGAFANFAIQLKKHNINIWAYTGYTFEELLLLGKKNASIRVLLKNIDVLVDGKFIESLAGNKIKYRGSSNQRLIDVPNSLRSKKIIIINI